MPAWDELLKGSNISFIRRKGSVERIILKFKNDFHSKKPRQSESHKSQPVS